MSTLEFMIADITGIRWLILCIAAVPLVYYLVAIYCGWEFFRRRSSAPPPDLPGVSLLKPMKGLDHETYENLASFCRQDYPEFEILFGFNHPEDAAIPVVRRIMADFPGIPMRMMVGTSVQGANNKVAKVWRLAREARHCLLVVSDSDTRVGSDYLRRMIAPFGDACVGAASTLYRGITLPNLWSELEALSLSTDFLPSTLVARKLGLKFALGASMAVRREALEAIGGFESLADMAADDHELGRRVADAKYGVELVNAAVRTECSSRGFGDYFRHQVRWSVVTRESKPWGHLGFIFAQGFPWTVVAIALAPTLGCAAGFLAAYLGLRFALAFSVGASGLRDPLVENKWWLIPASDAISFVIWCTSLFVRRVYWQGVAYRVRHGHLVRHESNHGASQPAPTTSRGLN